jgi:imidazoleglycerol-phosphate dehydratase
MSRRATVERATKETSVRVTLELDGSGNSDVSTGIGFFDHMLEQLAKHGVFDLELQAKGDLQIDAHHTVEDCGLAVGQALKEALGDKTGIQRMGDALVPLDETLARAAVDLSGRGHAYIDLQLTDPFIGELPAGLLEHFLESLARAAEVTLHVEVLRGEMDHHRAEAAFKALARALKAAVALDPRRTGAVPSTKGTL